MPLKHENANKLPFILTKPKVEILTCPPQKQQQPPHTHTKKKHLEKYLLIQRALLIM